MSDVKSKIRRSILFNRRLLSNQVFNERNDLVIDRLDSFLALKAIQHIHCFLPILRNREIDTWPLIKKLTEQGKDVVVSATDFEKQTMSHFGYSSDMVLENDRFGIPTPVSGKTAPIELVDCIIIPMLAGDKKGNRIGYGKGYYDRLLAEMSVEVLKVGITLGSLFDNFNFVEPHDICLDYVITPFETVKCYE
ncbi:MAG: 5-formyltetrahydrofolate cyclo-ligase [Marinoscillum sp.]